MSIHKRFSRVVAVALVIGLLLSRSIVAAESETARLRKSFRDADAVFFATLISSRPLANREGFQSTFQIGTILKDQRGKLKGEETIDLLDSRNRAAGKPLLLFTSVNVNGKPFLIQATDDSISREILSYVKEFPASTQKKEFVDYPAPSRAQISYALKFLEHPESPIAEDAYSQIEHADRKDLFAVANEFPRKKLRQWVVNSATDARRVNQYWIMLGLCGRREDLPLYEQRLTPVNTERNWQIMAGYLLLARQAGLARIEEQFLKNKELSRSDAYHVCEALSYVRTCTPVRISNERLQRALLVLLDHPDLSSHAVHYLTRWKDWSVRKRLMTLYEQKVDSWSTSALRPAIMKYLVACEADWPEEAAEPPEHVREAREFNRKIGNSAPSPARKQEAPREQEEF